MMNGGSSSIAQGIFQPFQTKLLCILRAFDVEWNTKCQIRVVKKAPSEEEQSKLIGESSFEMHEGRRAFRDLSTSVADWEEIS